MDHYQLRMCHFRKFTELYLREIAPDEADVAPAIALFLFTVPVGELCAALGGRGRQSVIVAGPEDIADRPVRVGFQIALQSVILLRGVMSGKGKAFRGNAASRSLRLFAAILKDSTSRASSSFRTGYGNG